MSTLPSTPKNPFGNCTGRCIGCGRDPGLKQWHGEGDLLCWPCWLKVERLGDDREHREVVFSACRLLRAGHVESVSAADHDVLTALGLLVE